jgi:hypothetical protein
MKTIFITLLFLGLTISIQAQTRKKQDIQANPLDIVEYYLIMPSEQYWDFEGKTQDPFTARQQYLKSNSMRKVTIDKKNAYLTISDISNELEFKLTMCYFVKADKTKILAVHYYNEGGDCDSHLLKFYTYAAGKWTDVTEKVLPVVTLKNYGVQEKNFLAVDFLYTLPQFGTDIKVRASSICEQDDPARLKGKDFMAYWESYKKLGLKTLLLKWNKVKGVFEPGPLQ